MFSAGPFGSKPYASLSGSDPTPVTVPPIAAPLVDLPARKPAQLLSAILAGFCFSPVLTTVEQVTVDKWQKPLELPPQHRVVPRYQHQFAFAVADPTETRVDRWQTPLQTPRREKPSLSQAHLLFSHDARQSVPETRVDKFWQPLQLPTRRAPALLDALKPQVFAVFSDPFGEQVRISSWHTPLGLPVRAKPSPIPPFSFAAAQTLVAPNTVDQWFTPLSVPVRAKISPVPLLSGIVAQPIVVTQSIDKWFTPLNLPVRARFTPTPPFNFAATRPIIPPSAIDQWYSPLSVPIRVRPQAYQERIAQSRFIVPPVVSTWHTPLSQPVRVPPPPAPLIYALQQTIVPTVLVGQWYTPLSQPYYSARFSTALHDFGIPQGAIGLTLDIPVPGPDNNVTAVPPTLGLITTPLTAVTTITGTITANDITGPLSAATDITTTPEALEDITT